MPTRFDRYLESILFRSIVVATLLLVAAFFLIKPDIHGDFATYNEYQSNKSPDHSEEGKIFFGLSPEGWTAVFTFGLFIATLALFVATYALFKTAARESDKADEALAIAKVSADASKLAAEVAQKSLAASHRAWIEPQIRPGTGSLIFNELAGHYGVKVAFKNTGNIPATNILIDVWLVAQFMKSPIGEGIVSVCPSHNAKLAKSRARKDWRLGQTLFPGEQFPEAKGYSGFEAGCTIPADEIAACSFLSEGKKFVVLYVGGAINYNYATDVERHQSSFLYELTFKGISCCFDISRIYSADELALVGIIDGEGRQAD